MILYFDWIVQKTNSDFVLKFAEGPPRQLNQVHPKGSYCESVYKNNILFVCKETSLCLLVTIKYWVKWSEIEVVMFPDVIFLVMSLYN